MEVVAGSQVQSPLHCQTRVCEHLSEAGLQSWGAGGRALGRKLPGLGHRAGMERAKETGKASPPHHPGF